MTTTRPSMFARFGRSVAVTGAALAVVLVPACGSTAGSGSGSNSSVSGSAGSRPAGSGTTVGRLLTEVPDSTLAGAGAFQGPVHTVPVGSLQVAYRQFGSGPPVVLLTGENTAMTAWPIAFLQAFAATNQVTIIDNQGVGRSTDDPTRPMTIRGMADNTAGLIQAIGLDHPVIVGWSMGGAIALALAVDHPGVAGPIIVSGATAGGANEVPPTPEVIAKLADPATPPAEFLQLMFPPTAKAQIDAYGLTYVQVPQERSQPPPSPARRRRKRRSAWTSPCGTAARRAGHRRRHRGSVDADRAGPQRAAHRPASLEPWSAVRRAGHGIVVPGPGPLRRPGRAALLTAARPLSMKPGSIADRAVSIIDISQ
jgi:pimeloyl-ACP methyl ester carboxylesterase